MAKAKEKRSFEEMLAELQGLLANLEQGELPLEQLLAQYQQATELVAACQQRLSKAAAVLGAEQEGERHE